ncbi:Ditrans,polycis-undecaprenyl-diphosphate synthase ((2E,6E)-farnesyl-diphosphate specific) [Methanimicrococcus sp. At1]|uniref:Ditrans,polycis-undecaprenyl-diphosphate synthase ((2E,6E)-farnesyl-diphosphate specific) n=1 Tax=Methanimicrococcus hacksteinii TaxID=3028293 RepID=A0ABU3VR00_9EURY|nr:undecaprenyl diphosphate synthase family protein [Methanimicrococcus sp. At1]MDV0445830.1 Ditrans,polycis-undecaprenyl-diphosphate synthase ((2E,6E)-farnesyl-diphosphate specific) [Methanimicrococcus sp. At1]
MKTENETPLKTLLLILNESDLLDNGSIENLFSRFSVIENEGVLNLIVYIDFLKTMDTGKKASLIRNLKERILAVSKSKDFQFDPNRFAVIENYDDSNTFPNPGSFPDSDSFPDSESFLKSGRFSALFVLGLGGRDELKLILSDFVEKCRKNEAGSDEMTSEYLSNQLKLPSEPDFVISHTKNTLTDFMLWQTVYSEYYFFEKDIRRLTDADFKKAFDSFYKRERRYGV